MKLLGYFAFRDGKPDWDEDCVCTDPVYPAGDDDDQVSVPIYVMAAKAEGGAA